MKFSKIVKVMFVSAASTILLSACSSGETAPSPKVQVTEENKSYLEEYDKNIQSYMKEMTTILQDFNNALDKLYTKEYTYQQFIASLKGSIAESNKLVTKVETLDVDPTLFESHQGLIVLVNNSHQLLLNAVDMANQPEYGMDKNSLRDQYMQIKTEQANLANQWKVLRAQLTASTKAQTPTPQ